MAIVLLLRGALFDVHVFAGLFRSFAPCLCMLSLWLLWERRRIAAAWSLIPHVLFYPPTTLVLLPVIALSTACATRLRLREHKRELLGVAGAALFCLALLQHFGTRSPEIGKAVGLDRAALMREFTQGGRLAELPFPGVAEMIGAANEHTLRSYSRSKRVLLSTLPLPEPLPPLLFASALGALLLILAFMRPGTAGGFLLLFASALMLFLLSKALAFRLGFPNRYVAYVLPVTMVFLWPATWHAVGPRPGLARGTVLFLGGILLFSAPWSYSNLSRKTIDVADRKPVLDALARLEPDTLITAWPGLVLDDIPLFSRREVLFNHENAHPLYEPYYGTIRKRVLDTVRLAFSGDPAEAAAIRDEYGLTHLVLEYSLFDPTRSSPGFFAPLDEAAAFYRMQKLRENLLFASPPEAWVRYRDSRFLVLDLREIEAAPQEPALHAPADPARLAYPLDLDFIDLRVEGGGAKPGQLLRLDFTWRAPAPLSFARWVVFVHFRREGRNEFGGDHPLFINKDRGAHAWTLTAPMTMRYTHQVPLRPDLPPGEYEVWLGLLNPVDGKRIAPVCGTPTVEAAYDTGIRLSLPLE